MESSSTIGCVLIKLSVKESRGKHDIFKRYLLNKIVSQGAECKKIQEQQKCSCNILLISTVTGFFDFLLVLEIPCIHDLESFVLNCLRAGEMGSMISETQTISGLLHYIKGK